MRLQSVTLLVPDYDKGIAFFVTGLGWSLLSDDELGDKRWVVVAPPGGGASLLLARPVGDQVRAMGDQAGGRVGFFLWADDFGAASARIEAAGGLFEEEPRRASYGTVAVWRDPWGNRWDLLGPA